jgi:hypothetical protein
MNFKDLVEFRHNFTLKKTVHLRPTARDPRGERESFCTAFSFTKASKPVAVRPVCVMCASRPTPLFVPLCTQNLLDRSTLCSKPCSIAAAASSGVTTTPVCVLCVRAPLFSSLSHCLTAPHTAGLPATAAAAAFASTRKLVYLSAVTPVCSVN